MQVLVDKARESGCERTFLGSKEEFLSMVERDEFLEYAFLYGDCWEAQVIHSICLFISPMHIWDASNFSETISLELSILTSWLFGWFVLM